MVLSYYAARRNHLISVAYCNILYSRNVLVVLAIQDSSSLHFWFTRIQSRDIVMLVHPVKFLVLSYHRCSPASDVKDRILVLIFKKHSQVMLYPFCQPSNPYLNGISPIQRDMQATNPVEPFVIHPNP